MRSAVRKVTIVGRDAAAWLSALALQVSFGRGDSDIEVELIELPSALGPRDYFTTLPAQRTFHDLLGLDENRLLNACSGIYSLGQRFSNWSGPAAPFLHAYDTHGVSLNHVEFLQYWLKARAGGLNVPLEDFSLGAVAAKQGRFVLFNQHTASFSNASYGYHLDAIPYLRSIGRAAIHAGLRHTRTKNVSANVKNGRIHSLTLENDETVQADLFIDASGPSGSLILALEKDNHESWSDCLPCDRIAIASAASLTPVPAFAQISAFHGGWIGIHPLTDRSALTCAWSSAHVDQDDIPDILSTLAGMKLEGDIVVSSLSPGTLKRHWIGNCVAVGDTAVNLAPLDATQLQMLNTGLSHLVSLFPVDRYDLKETAIYNARMARYAAGVRDFQIAHYALNRRFDNTFWNAVRERDVPDSLAHKLALFECRGIVAMNEHETFQDENWMSIFVGHGLMPNTWSSLADNVPEQEQIANFQRILKFIASEVETMPSLQAHIELNSSGSSDYIF